MFRWLTQALYISEPARFRSDYPLQESVSRLRGAVKRHVFLSLFRQAAVGPVKEDRVRIARVIPFFGNSFKPVFVGKFQSDSNGVVLDGRFTMWWITKAFMTVWFGFVIIWTVLATPIAILMFGAQVLGASRGRVDEHLLLFPLVGIGFLLAGYAFLRFGWWLSRGDIAYLTNVIETALIKAPEEANGERGGQRISGNRHRQTTKRD